MCGNTSARIIASPWVSRNAARSAVFFLDTAVSRVCGGGMNALAARDRAVMADREAAEEEAEVGKKDAVSQLHFSAEALRLLRRVKA